MGTILAFPLRDPSLLRRTLGPALLESAGDLQGCAARVRATGETGMIAGWHRESGMLALLKGVTLRYFTEEALEIVT